jgi:hypothetical protein
MADSGRKRAASEGDYQATIDSIARSAERVTELEEEKAELSPSDPRARELTSAVESEVDKMERDSEAQSSLVDEAASEERGRPN